MPASSSTSPPTPSYIFRHHNHPIHALHFFQQNQYFASGDSSGLLVIWRLLTRRPVAIFQAHDAGIMRIADWGARRLITHGRDHKLRVWDLKLSDLENTVGKPVQRLAADQGAGGHGVDDTQKPWLLHSMSVNALNFCAFSTCPVPEPRSEPIARETPSVRTATTLDLEYDDQKSAFTTKGEAEPISSGTTSPPSTAALLIASPNGLDSGGIDTFHLPSEHRITQIRSTKDSKAGMVMALNLSYSKQTHRFLLVAGYEDGSVSVYEASRPFLASPSSFQTHPWLWTRTLTSRPHSQPVLSLDVVPDQSAFITSSADAMIVKLAMPKSLDGEFAVGMTEPERVQNTKHAGQQDLKIRNDGRIFATAGWDGSVRVYSVKSCKELAVLQWHKEGCFAVTFADVEWHGEIRTDDDSGMGSASQGVVRVSAIDKMKQEREKKVHNTHWIVAGSKDGKISLWDIY